MTGGVRSVAGNFFRGAGAEIRNIAGGLDAAAGAVRNLFRPKAGADDVAEAITGGKPLGCHSFATGTGVHMADGTTKPIE